MDRGFGPASAITRTSNDARQHSRARGACASSALTQSAAPSSKGNWLRQESVLEDERNEKPGPVFVAGEGAPHALIIVPVPVGAAAHRHPASRKTSLFIHFERDGAAILTDVELGTR
jgi:hypothetical protein